MIRYRLDHTHNCVFVQNTGVCDTDAILEHIKRLIADPDYKQGMNEIVDLTHIDAYTVDPQGIRAVVSEEIRGEEDLKLARLLYLRL